MASVLAWCCLRCSEGLGTREMAMSGNLSMTVGSYGQEQYLSVGSLNHNSDSPRPSFSESICCPLMFRICWSLNLCLTSSFFLLHLLCGDVNRCYAKICTNVAMFVPSGTENVRTIIHPLQCLL